MQRWRAFRPSAVVPGIVVCAVLAPLAVHWLAGQTLVWFDSLTLYAPQRWIVDEALRAFRLPLWNPYAGAGLPFFADAIHGVLHPVSVLTAWLHTDKSLDVLIGGYVICAGLGATLLSRELGASWAGAAVSGIAYGASGYVLSMTGNLVFLAGAGSLPFCLAGLRRFAVEPAPGSLAFAVGGVAVLALSGDAQALMVAGVLALALAWEGGGWRGAARAAASGVVGLLVAGVQLFPTAIHLPRTVRTEALWNPTPGVWPFEPWRLPELVLPGMLGGPDPFLDPVFLSLTYPQGMPEGGHAFPFAVSVFVGLVPMALAAAGARRGRLGRLLGLAALVLLWVALGPTLGADAVLGHVPIWKAFRYSEKLVGPLTLVLAALAGLGLEVVVERRAAGRSFFLGAALLGLGSIVASRMALSGLAPDVASLADARAARGAWHVAGAVVALAAWVLARERLGGSLARGVMILLAWAGATAGSTAALRPGDPEARLRSPGPALEAPPPGPRIVTPPTVARLPHVPGADRIGEFARDFAAIGHPAYNVRFRVDSLSEYAAMAPPRLALLHSYLQERWPVAARRYAVTHLFLDPSLKRTDPALHAAATSGGTRLGAGPGSDDLWLVPHREWASFAPEVRVVGGWQEAAVETGRSLADGSEAVVVEASSPFRAGRGRVLSVERGLETIRVEAEAEGEATLVVADAWWPGWEATVDGRNVTAFPADVLIRAVRWPAGRHVLEMRYRPPELRTGLALSALGVLGMAAWTAYLVRARSRRPCPLPADAPGERGQGAVAPPTVNER